ncbi:hypothetical protein ACFC5Z_12825 [Streptomyces sp. NPDC056004]
MQVEEGVGTDDDEEARVATPPQTQRCLLNVAATDTFLHLYATLDDA